VLPIIHIHSSSNTYDRSFPNTCDRSFLNTCDRRCCPLYIYTPPPTPTIAPSPTPTIAPSSTPAIAGVAHYAYTLLPQHLRSLLPQHLLSFLPQHLRSQVLPIIHIHSFPNTYDLVGTTSLIPTVDLGFPTPRVKSAVCTTCTCMHYPRGLAPSITHHVSRTQYYSITSP